ncbi:23S rRNA (guanosine2251-2'-O)-methyltransferase [Azospirillaceae bacterium]
MSRSRSQPPTPPTPPPRARSGASGRLPERGGGFGGGVSGGGSEPPSSARAAGSALLGGLSRTGVALYGVHAVAAAWVNPVRQCRRLLATESGLTALTPALERAHQERLSRPPPMVVGRTELDRMLPAGTVHQGVLLDAAPLPDVNLEHLCRSLEKGGTRTVLVLDQVTDPHNVGAILRSAAAFGAGGVVDTERDAPEAAGVVAKTASGGLEIVPLVRVINLARSLQELQKAGFWCVGLTESATLTISEARLSDRVALVLGAEGTGLRRLTSERCDLLVRLPTQPPIGSLNVSNAAAVVLYEWVRRGGFS